MKSVNPKMEIFEEPPQNTSVIKNEMPQNNELTRLKR